MVDEERPACGCVVWHDCDAYDEVGGPMIVALAGQTFRVWARSCHEAPLVLDRVGIDVAGELEVDRTPSVDGRWLPFRAAIRWRPLAEVATGGRG